MGRSAQIKIQKKLTGKQFAFYKIVHKIRILDCLARSEKTSCNKRILDKYPQKGFIIGEICTKCQINAKFLDNFAIASPTWELIIGACKNTFDPFQKVNLLKC